jgi:hypothetical protein
MGIVPIRTVLRPRVCSIKDQIKIAVETKLLIRAQIEGTIPV